MLLNFLAAFIIFHLCKPILNNIMLCIKNLKVVNEVHAEGFNSTHGCMEPVLFVITEAVAAVVKRHPAIRAFNG